MRRWQWNELQPVVSYANYLKCEPGFSFGPRIILNHQFIYVVKGEGTAEIAGREYRASEGALFYYGPQIVHRFRADDRKPFELIGIHFSLQGDYKLAFEPVPVVDALSTSLAAASPASDTDLELRIGRGGLEELRISSFTVLEGKEIGELFLQMVEHYNRLSDMMCAWNRGLMLQALATLHRLLHSGKTAHSPDMAVLHRIRSHLALHADDKYDRSWLHQWTGYNEDYASRLFHDRFGLSPSDYHSLQRRERAKELLAYSDLSITQVAETLSFQTIHYFSRWFKKTEGVTPSAYRRNRRFL